MIMSVVNQTNFDSIRFLSERIVTDFANLPDVVLSNIFNFLNQEDRRNVRLTCSNWDRCAIHGSVSQKEILKIIFCNEERNILVGNRRRTYNLKFVFADFQYYRNNFIWGRYGPAIRELILSSCSINSSGFEQILQFCPLMKKISFSNMLLLNVAPECLDTLVHMKFEHKCLRNWEFINNTIASYPTQGFQKIFQICPNIKEVKVLDQEISKCFTQYIPDTIEKFSIACDFEKSVMDMLKTVPRLNLKELTIKTAITSYTESDFHSLFKNLPGLEKLILILDKWPMTGKHVFSILTSCSKLKELNLSSFHNINHLRLSWDEYAQFLYLSTKLKKLSLPSILLPAEPMPPTIFPSYQLQHLSIGSVEERSITLLLENHSFKHLELKEPTDSILQIVCKTQHELESLALVHLMNCSEVGFMGYKNQKQRHHIGYLKKLKYLSLQTKCSRSEAGFNSISFFLWLPQSITHLRLECRFSYCYFSRHSLEFIPEVLPNLEAFSLKCTEDLNLDHLKVALSAMKNIRTFVTDLNLGYNQLKHIALNHPKLRTVCLQNNINKHMYQEYTFNRRLNTFFEDTTLLYNFNGVDPFVTI